MSFPAAPLLQGEVGHRSQELVGVALRSFQKGNYMMKGGSKRHFSKGGKKINNFALSNTTPTYSANFYNIKTTCVQDARHWSWTGDVAPLFEFWSL